MLTFTVDFSVNRHKLIIYVVILLRANILENWFTPWLSSFKLSCAKNFSRDKHVIAMCPRAIKD